ncbi:MAG: PorT family protein [Bacteroidales bacterium]|nr:PorT family protein [Bacteroidales bacterium]
MSCAVCVTTFAQTQVAKDSVPTQESKSFYENTKSIAETTVGIIKSAAVGVEYRLKAGIAVGGTSPLPVPEEIRGLNSFNPGLNLSIEGEVVKLFDNTYGLAFGLRLESKGMETDARVKGYQITLDQDDQQIAGYFWGNVKTKVDNAYLTLPVLAVWKPADRWAVRGGLYGSYAFRRNFSGLAYNGYLREGDPTGTYVEIGESNGLYDFSDQVRHWFWGARVGGEWQAFTHLLVGADLTWGLNSIFPKDFEAIAFKMFPIYGTLSFGYRF